jgi:Cu2+-exporting ATPase
MFEEARRVNYVVFDKTGTLTKGDHTLASIPPAEGICADEVLRLAAAAEFEAEHMLGRAVVKAARDKNISIPPASGFESMPGKGVTAIIEGQRVQVGGPNLAFQLGANIPASLAEANRNQVQAGNTVVYLFINNEIKGLVTLADTIKEESAEAIKEIKSMGIKVAMLTGDNEAVANRISNQLGIDEYFAGVLPENKAAKVKSLQAKGYRVAMVGDGVNDAPALAQADVGIAIGAGTDVAVESAGIILVKSDPRDVARLFILSQATYHKMVQNLAWATAYNILVIPLAAGVLAPWGFILPMAAGAVVMSLSTIIVAVNAQFLKNVQTAW